MRNNDNTLFVTDAEIRRRLGIPEKRWRQVKRDLDKRKPGRRPFPPKQAMFGGRRWWPDVYAYFNDIAASEGSNATSQPTREDRDPRPEVAPPKGRLGRLLDLSRGHC